MSDTRFANVLCSVEIYPFEGGIFAGSPIVVDPGQVRAVTVYEPLREGESARFRIVLAPGGPGGTEGFPTWSQVITPASLAVIGMARGSNGRITMVGPVVSATETQQWDTGEDSASATRVQVIEGENFGWYFNRFNWAGMTFLGAFGLALGAILPVASAGLPMLVAQGALNQGKPGDVARAWYNFMLASGGVMGQARVPYRNNTTIPVSGALTALFENYDDLYVPVATYFTAHEGSWTAKFMEMLPFPYYEFFVATAPSGVYDVTITDANAATSNPNPGTVPVETGTNVNGTAVFSDVSVKATRLSKGFTMDSMPWLARAFPTVVGRVNPTPNMDMAATSPGQSPTIGSIDVSRWNKLPRFDLQDLNFISSTVRFAADQVCNLYQLNPTFYRPLWDNNANQTPFTYYWFGAGDPASIHRYGYHPEGGLRSFFWLADPNGIAAQQGRDISQTVATLTAKVFSWFEPEPLMARAEIAMPFRPDILPGCVFTYRPFKGQDDWDFYIESATHSYVFGGPSTTTLVLSRGLPSAVYADSSDGGVLANIHVGNAMRQAEDDGLLYRTGLPPGLGVPLVAFGTQPDVQQFVGAIAPIYMLPQRK